MTIKSVLVVGAGTMGSGIAALSALHGFRTNLIARNTDRARARLEATIAKVRLRMPGPANPEGLSTPSVVVTDRIPDECVDIVIECLPEDQEIKKTYLDRLSEVLSIGTVITSNTSCLDPKKVLGGCDSHPCFGLHFFNPPTLMKLVEVAPINPIAQERLGDVMAFCEQLGRVPVIVPDSPGYVANRLIDALINRAARLIDELNVPADVVDQCMLLGANHPIGPLKLADLIGIDVLVANLEALWAAHGGDEYKPAESLRRLLDAGRFGRKSGAGYYTYEKR